MGSEFSIVSQNMIVIGCEEKLCNRAYPFLVYQLLLFQNLIGSKTRKLEILFPFAHTPPFS